MGWDPQHQLIVRVIGVGDPPPTATFTPTSTPLPTATSHAATALTRPLRHLQLRRLLLQRLPTQPTVVATATFTTCQHASAQLRRLRPANTPRPAATHTFTRHTHIRHGQPRHSTPDAIRLALTLRHVTPTLTVSPTFTSTATPHGLPIRRSIN